MPQEKNGAKKNESAGAGPWSVDESMVRRVATIARLNLTDDEAKKFTAQLKSILQAFRDLDEVDTANVRPSFHPQELKNDWREDEVRPWQWQPLANTKHKEGKHFKGPRIV